MITAEELRAKFNYDPTTGDWNKRKTLGSRSRVKGGQRVGSIKKEGYVVIRVNGERMYAHRLAFLWMTGFWPDDQIDHIDGNKANNSWTNLRQSTQAENTYNKSISSRNRCGFKGVFFHAQTGKWRSRIQKERNVYELGLHATPEAAHQAYRKAAVKIHGKFARFG